MKKILSVFIMLALLGISSAALSITNITISKSDFKPGESGTITLGISNTAGSDEITGVALTVYGTPEFTYWGSTRSIGDMNPGTSTQITIPIKASADAKSGIYVFEFRLEGYVTTSGESNLNYKGASTPVQILRKPIFTISGYDSVYREGTPFTFQVNNYGGAAKDVRVKVLSPFSAYNNAGLYPNTNAGENILSPFSGYFSSYDNTDLYIPQIDNNYSGSFNLNVVGVSEGQNTIWLGFTYDDELGIERYETKGISLTVKKEQTDLVFSQESEITSRADSILKLKVSNSGKELKDVRLDFDTPGIIPKTGGEIKFGDIATGEEKTVDFPAYVDISPGTKSLNATITYTEDGKEKTKSASITLTVSSDSDVQVLVEAKPLPLSAGQEETISITVANTWDYPIESVSVRMEGDFYQMISVQNEQYIGLLNKDDFSSVQFKVNIRNQSIGDVNLTAYVKYKDPSGNWVQKTKVIPLTVHAKTQAQGVDILVYIAGAIALIAVYLIFFRKKK